MSDVEKKLVEEARQYFNSIPTLYTDNLDGHIIHAYVIGGLKSREAMLSEVLEYLRSEEAMKMDNAYAERNDCMMDRTLWVKELESKFKGVKG